MNPLIGKFFISSSEDWRDGRDGEIVGVIDGQGCYYLARFSDDTLMVVDIDDMRDWILFDTAEAKSAYQRRSQAKLRVVPLHGDEPA